jgi:spermidine synthase
VYALFFLSGAAGLMYQVVWSRLLNEIFGVTVHAITAVLATYLGGLALGSWVLGRAVDRRADPLRFYGWLELGIGATALAGTWMIRALDPIHIWAASRMAPDSLALLVVRSLLASVVILPPTFLMGGTLAAITKAFVDRIGTLGRALSLLYAINTAGAVAGTLLAGFGLIRVAGVHPTLWLAVAVNGLVGAASLVLSARLGEPAHRRAMAPMASAEAVEPDTGPGAAGFWLLIAVALSGFASLSLEVIWTRMLVLIVGTSTYAFVTMLAAFLVGIATGSLAVRALVDRLSNPRRTFGWLQVGIAVSTLGTLPLMRLVMLHGPRWFGGDPGWLGLMAGRFAVSFLVMIVPTTLIGMTFPLASRIWARSFLTLGGRVGQVYSANALGNILGALGGGFVVLPWLGMQKGIAIVATVNLAAATWGLLPSSENRRRPAVLLRAAPLSAVLWTCVLLLLLWHPGPLPGTGGGEWDPVWYYREGLVSTVKVIQKADDGRQLLMLVDGVTIGQSATGVDKKQQVLAHLPFALAPERAIRTVLSIGLGTGILVGEVAKHPGVASVECVEISPSVIEGARLFTAHNGNVLQNPAVHVVTDDGVNFLRRSRSAYDAIISDGKSKSGHAGNALFYSEDYYRIAREHLAGDGLMIQWVPLDVTPEDLRIIVRTFVTVFPHTYVWLGDEALFMVGKKQPLVLDLAHVQEALGRPEFAGLRRHGWAGAAEVASLLVADGSSLAGWIGSESTINSLERPVLEFYPPSATTAPEPERLSDNLAALAAVRRAGLHDVRTVGLDRTALEPNHRAVDRLLEGLAAMPRDARVALPLLESAVAEAPRHEVIRHLVGEAVLGVGVALDTRGQLAAAAALYARAFRAWPGLTEAHLDLGRVLAAQGRTDEAVTQLSEALESNPESGAAHRILGQILLAKGDAQHAAIHLREAARLAPAAAEIHEDLGVSLAAMGRTDDGLLELREALRLRPAWPLAMNRVAIVLATHPDPRGRNVDEAIRLGKRAAKLTDGRDPMSLEILAASYAAAGRFEDAARAQQQAVDLADATGNAELAAAARQALGLYRRGQSLPLDLPAPRRPGAL